MNSDALERTRQLLSYSTQHPCRSPSWRWEYVQRLVALDSQLLTNREDRWIRAAHDFLGYEVTGQVDQRTHTQLDVSDAHEIYQSNGPVRWELEARILGGERYAAIAEKLGTRIGVVKAYQNLFFHVKPKVKCRDYIHNVVIGTFRPWDPTGVRDLWCYFAYSAGPEMVDFLVSDFRSSQKADYGHLTDGSEPDPNRSTLGRKFDRCLKMMFLAVNEKTILPLIELRIEVMAAEKRHINPFTENSIADNVDRMLAETLKVGKSAKKASGGRKKRPGGSHKRMSLRLYFQRRYRRLVAYRSVSIGGSGGSRYFGSGQIAELALEAVQYLQERRNTARKTHLEAVATSYKADSPVQRSCGTLMSLFRGQLYSAGFHQHKNTWRRRGKRRKAQTQNGK